ncbi:MAG: TldD/PmbA family protein [Candidatus Eisenbacteria bacterium]
MSGRHAPPEQLLDLCAQVVERARAHGAQVADACAESSRAFTVRVHGGSVDTLKQSGTRALGVRAIVDGGVGFTSGTDLSREGLDDLARRAVALARFATPDEANGAPLPGETGGDASGDLMLFDPAALELSSERKIEMALELERLTLAADRRVTRTDGASVSSAGGAFALVNSHGVARAWEGTSVSGWVVALADDRDGRQQTGAEGMSVRHLADFAALETLARGAATRAVNRIGARTVPSARVPVIMHPDIAAAWISEMADAWSGESVLKRSSWLSERLGQNIASPLVTLVDDGTLPRRIGSSPYDGEGRRTRRNVLLDRGRLAMFMYDDYHARRTGVPATANGLRGWSSTPGIGYHNLYVEPGAESPEAILKRIDRGFYYDDQGSFGFNSVTGDYSFQAQGYWIENGEKAYPVDGITVAGNSLDMLKSIAAVGNDLDWRSSVACPTLLIGEMTVSGT